MSNKRKEHGDVAPSAWVTTVRAMVDQTRRNAGDTENTRPLRTRLHAAADPAGVQQRDNAITGVACAGDARLRNMQYLLDNMGEQRSTPQRLWHWHMTNACLPHIYGKEWPQASYRVMRQRGLTTLKQVVLIMTFRRAGKTVCLAQLLAAVLLNVPGIKIVIISTGDRASSKLKALVVSYLFRLPQGRRRVCGLTHEMLYVAERDMPEGASYRSIQAQHLQYMPGTATLEAIPNNPKGSARLVDVVVLCGDGRVTRTQGKATLPRVNRTQSHPWLCAMGQTASWIEQNPSSTAMSLYPRLAPRVANSGDRAFPSSQQIMQDIFDLHSRHGDVAAVIVLDKQDGTLAKWRMVELTMGAMVQGIHDRCHEVLKVR